ncbi:MAG: undecaprenyl-diphosphate phosphatase [Clostridia bacterium]|nr:undecaprenyl-diphosphate phosphatase [Clostridia bacterium]
MTIIQAIILGIVQGITEFFPISSSAHLIAIRYLFNFGTGVSSEHWLVIDIALHFGTLLAIGIYFFKDFIKMFVEGFKFKGSNGKLSFKNLNHEGKILWYIIAASIPGALAGLLLDDFIEGVVRNNVLIIATTLTIMGIALYFIDKKCRKDTTIEKLTLKQALLIGVGQAFAVIPGFSRSGTTMTVARSMGLQRESAAKFSFLLGAPAMLGAAVFSLKHFEMSMLNFEFFLGIAVSFVVGLIAIKTLMEIVRKSGFGVFAIYRVLLAIVLVVTYIVR